MSNGMTLGAEQWFEKGAEAMHARQLDYAVECLNNAVRLSPATARYRRAKHRCCRKRYKATATRTPRPSVKLVDIRRKLLQARLKGDWAAMDRWAEEGVIVQPSDPQFFAHMAAACTELGHTEVAGYAWAVAVKMDQSNVAYNRAYGRYLCGTGDYDGATRCFRRILDKSPGDRHATEMLHYVDVERLIKSGGYAAASGKRDLQTPEETAATGELADSAHHAADRAEQPPEPVSAGTVRSQSAEQANQLRLATLCAQQRRWEMCLEAYRKALKMSPDDISIRERTEDAELHLLRDNVEKQQRAAQQEVGSHRLAEEALVSERKLIERRIEIFRERAARYRSDMTMRFQLAEDYGRLGEYRQAIPLYQEACQNPKLREEALLKLGQCWICDDQKDLACRQFRLALTSLSPVVNPESWKTAHYWLGRLHETDGRTAEAKTHYAEVLLVDFGFRDAVSRLESLPGGALNPVREDA